MANSFANTAQLTCPQCQQAFSAEVWLIVDADERPDLLDRIRTGTLHDLACTHCGYAAAVDAPLLILRANATPVLLFSPAQNATSDQDREHEEELVGMLHRQLGNAWRAEWLANGLSSVERHNLPAALGGNMQDPEEMIRRYELALQSFTREAFPKRWATIQNNLAKAYSHRIRSDRADNLEEAIRHYDLALLERTREAFPEQWAWTQNDLGNAYRDRIRGERTDNLEEAIRHYDLALEVYTHEAFPSDWAMTQNNLATAYSDRIRGERADNLEEAIRHYDLALQIYTREAFPERWAGTQNNLATAYGNRIRGERADNLEEAIRYSELALEVYTREALPSDWAMTQNNLANAYSNRIRGARADNLEEAIRHYDLALLERTREAFPEQWATTQNNLANAYSDRIRGERADNLEEAIRHYDLALLERTREAFPEQWAMTQHNLANAYRDRIRGERAANLEEAIRHYDLALQMYTREAFPSDWAMTQNNLANAYSNRTPFLAEDARADNLEEAIRHYDLALQVRTRHAFPSDHRQTQRNLGNLHFAERRWTAALTAFTAALDANNDLLAAAYSEAGRRAEIAETSALYARAAYCHLQLNQYADALEQLEAGKTRLLNEALMLASADTANVTAERKDALNGKRQTIRELEAEMRLPPDTPARRSDHDLAELLRQARADLNQLIDAIRQDHPDFMPLGLTLSEILALIPEGGGLVAPVITSQGSAVFVVPHGAPTVTDEHAIRLDQFKNKTLSELLLGPADDRKWGGWMGAYLKSLLEGTASVVAEWRTAIEDLTGQIWNDLIEPVHFRLQELGIQRIVLMPAGGLQLLPLHTAWRMVGGAKRYFLDDYEVIYAPSAFTLKASRERAASRTGQTALVAGVSEYKELQPLHFTRAEVEEVGKLFNVQPLIDSAATPEAVREHASGAAYLHLSCHGSFAWGQDPLDSAVYLAEDRPLTLADILGKMDLNSARLVTLSACETGISDIRQSPDEYVGLPAGFLQAGAAGVVSSLWSVNDLSTALLMIRFYENHLKGKQPPAQALRQAQLWLRDVTNAELAELFDFYRKNAPDAPTRMTYATAQENFREHTLHDPNECPFAHPYYWAAFAFYGT